MHFVSIIFTIILFSGPAYTSDKVAELVKYKIQDSFDSRISYEVELGVGDNDADYESLSGYFSQQITDSSLKKENIFAYEFFYNKKTLKKHQLENWPQTFHEEVNKEHFSNLDFYQLEGDGSFLNDYLNRSPARKSSLYEANFKKKAFKWLAKNRRVTMTLTRVFVNGSISAISFYKGGMPPLAAVMMGALMGSVSGAFQLYNEPFYKFLSTDQRTAKIYNLLLRKIPMLEKVGLKLITKGKSSSVLASLLKSFVTEAFILSIFEASLVGLNSINMIDYGTSVMTSMEVIGATALKATASQGLLSTSVAKDLGGKTRRARELLVNAAWPEISEVEKGEFLKLSNDKLVQRASQVDLPHVKHLCTVVNELVTYQGLIALSASMTWAGAAVSTMMGLDLGNVLFFTMGATGALNHLKLKILSKNPKLKSYLGKIKRKCWSFL